jgi:excisionase family DNA binding protein
MLGVSRTAVYKKVRKGQIAATKVGRVYVISDTDVTVILGERMGSKDKMQVERAVRKTVADYGETLRLLGNE